MSHIPMEAASTFGEEHSMNQSGHNMKLDGTDMDNKGLNNPNGLHSMLTPSNDLLMHQQAAQMNAFQGNFQPYNGMMMNPTPTNNHMGGFNDNNIARMVNQTAQSYNNGNPMMNAFPTDNNGNNPATNGMMMNNGGFNTHGNTMTSGQVNMNPMNVLNTANGMNAGPTANAMSLGGNNGMNMGMNMNYNAMTNNTMSGMGMNTAGMPGNTNIHMNLSNGNNMMNTNNTNGMMMSNNLSGGQQQVNMQSNMPHTQLQQQQQQQGQQTGQQGQGQMNMRPTNTSGNGNSSGGGGGGGGSQGTNTNSSTGTHKTINIPKPWHTLNDSSYRKQMCDNIIQLLEQKKPNALEWKAKLPQMASKLEESLYYAANSLDEYRDSTTLKARLQQLAVQMGSKQPNRSTGNTSGNTGNNQQLQSGGNNATNNTMQIQGGQMNTTNMMNNNDMVNMQQQQRGGNGLMTPQHQQQQQQMNTNNAMNTAANNYLQNQNFMQQQQQRPFDMNANQPQMFNNNMSGNTVMPGTQNNMNTMMSMNANGMQGNMNMGGNNATMGVNGMPAMTAMNAMVTMHNTPNNSMMNNNTNMMGAFNNPMNTMNGNNMTMGINNNTMNNPSMMNTMNTTPNNMGMNNFGGGYPTGMNSGHMGSDMFGNPIPNPSTNNPNNPNTQPPQFVTMAQINPIVSGNNMVNNTTMNNNQFGSTGATNNNTMNMANATTANVTNKTTGSMMGMPTTQPGSTTMSAGMNTTNPTVTSTTNGSASLSGGGWNPNNNSSTSTNTNNSDEHRRQVLKQQQQRLLLLRHASKCTNDTDCKVTPHCANMKILWKHIMNCKNQECKTPHCVSSRYVLSHYSKCKDPTCAVCAPVREAIRQSVTKGGPLPIPIPTSIGKSTGTQQLPPNTMTSLDDPSTQPPPSKRPKLVMQSSSSIVIEPPMKDPTTTIISTEKKKLDPVSCGLYCLTNEQILSHLNGIHEGMGITASKVKEICMPLIDKLLKFPNAANVFGIPVDPILLGLPDYFEIVKFPMDLGTIKKKLENLHYRDTKPFEREVHLTFDNAILYNPKSSPVHSMAKQMRKDFDIEYKLAMKAYYDKLELCRLNTDACAICGETKLTFEPPVFYCNGTCGGQRIRRNAFYYSAGNNTFHWCSVCFTDLKESQPIPVGDQFITKSELSKSKKKHLDEAEEGWVECDGCKRWVHNICALFNTRRNFEDTSFLCPSCLITRRKESTDGLVSALTSKTKATDLPQNLMTQFIEDRINKRLNQAYTDDAEARGISINDVEKCPPLALRQVSCIDKMQPVRDGVCTRYKHKNYPTEFPCRTKCVVLFQTIDGQDVILFGMYVYEYGHKCPAPNQRRVYISYLDSVHYFRPKQYRTLVYHEVLLAYLEYVKRRGFHTAHIWSCPPSKGDDYIFYCHPNDQKTPKTDKLQKWYADMLDEGKNRGIITEITDLHTEFLVDPTYDATVLPYFEGDYWTTEAEVIIKNLAASSSAETATEDDGGHDETTQNNTTSIDSKKSKSKRKSTSSRPTRSGKMGSSSLITNKSDRDPVMTKLASIIEPMKNTFFVARLYPKEYIDSCSQSDSILATSAASTTTSTSTSEDKVISTTTEEGKKDETDLSSPSTTTSNGSTSDESMGGTSTTSTDNVKVDSTITTTDIQVDKEKEQEIAGVTVTVNVNVTENVTADMDVIENKSDIVDSTQPTTTTTITTTNTDTLIKSESTEVEKTVDSSNIEVKEDEMQVVKTEDTRIATTTPTDNQSTTTTTTPAVTSTSTETETPVKVEENATTTATTTATDATAQDVITATIPNTTTNNTTNSPTAATKTPTSSSSITNIKASASSSDMTESSLESKLAEIKDDTEDVDDVQESEHWDTRQSFLNLCQGNHYQFDQLRRAKHSSLLVLYLMHNPDAPKFLSQCHLCNKEINSGYRRRCEQCELDFCTTCYTAAINSGNRIHMHTLRAIPVSGTAPVRNLTPEERAERDKALKLHLELLVHASYCDNTVTCKDKKNCPRMKDFFNHLNTCQSASKGCTICKKVKMIITIHARQCRTEGCRVPKCTEVKENYRQSALRQQQMDDRRRAMCNEMYHNPVTSNNNNSGGGSGGSTHASNKNSQYDQDS